jgi:hypothetical protein
MAAKTVQVEALSPLRLNGDRLEIGGVCELPQDEAEELVALQYPAVKILSKVPASPAEAPLPAEADAKSPKK